MSGYIESSRNKNEPTIQSVLESSLTTYSPPKRTVRLACHLAVGEHWIANTCSADHAVVYRFRPGGAGPAEPYRYRLVVYRGGFAPAGDRGQRNLPGRKCGLDRHECLTSGTGLACPQPGYAV